MITTRDLKKWCTPSGDPVMIGGFISTKEGEQWLTGETFIFSVNVERQDIQLYPKWTMPPWVDSNDLKIPMPETLDEMANLIRMHCAMRSQT